MIFKWQGLSQVVGFFWHAGGEDATLPSIDKFLHGALGHSCQIGVFDMYKRSVAPYQVQKASSNAVVP